MRAWLALTTIVLVLGACADEARDDVDVAPEDAPTAPPGPPPSAAPPQDAVQPTAAQTFQCGDLRFTVRYDAAMAHLDLPDRSLQLPMTQGGPGAQYSDGQSTFRVQAGTASLDLPDATYPDCQEVPPGDVSTGS